MPSASRNVAVDADGSLYIADGHNHAIRRVDPAGTITTPAGTGERGFSGDCEPAAPIALNSPWGLAIRDGVPYIVDMDNARVRVMRL